MKLAVSRRVNHVKMMITLPFGFYDSMVILGYKKSLTTKDLWALRDRDKASTVMPKFMKHWDKERSVILVIIMDHFKISSGKPANKCCQGQDVLPAVNLIHLKLCRGNISSYLQLS